jgi:hypothetical protein
MSDFDTVLERLVTDPGFPAALAADPATALAGYQLSAEEVDLLRSQVSAGDGGDRTVETRTSKASMMGLLAPLAGFGLGSGGGTEIGRGLAPHPHEHFGANVHSGLSPVDSAHGEGSARPDAGAVEAGRVGQSIGPAEGPVAGAGDQVATNYHPHIDADGDGHWDKYLAVRHADGGVDVYEDRNGDGRVDFIGHDANGDGILESADYDENFDGVTDTHMTDTNGDGWMDTRSSR